MQINIHFTMTDVQQQAGLMLAYMQVQQIQDDDYIGGHGLNCSRANGSMEN